MAPVLVGALIGGATGVILGTVAGLVIDHFAKVSELNRETANEVFFQNLQKKFKETLESGDHANYDAGLGKNETALVCDIGDKETWDVRSFIYDEKKDTYRSVTKIDFDNIDETLAQELLKEECIIL